MGRIIIDGCDCAGKSTLGQKLAEKTGYEIVKGSSFEISQLGVDGMFNYMMKLLDKDNIIIDRFYLSNFVYGNLYDYPTMTGNQFAQLAEKAERKALTIYVQAPESVIKSRMIKRGDDMIKVDEIERILCKYDEALASVILRPRSYIAYDSYLHANGGEEGFVLMVSEMLKAQETKMYFSEN